MATVGELIAGRELLWNLTLRELRGKYKRTALGWAWSLLNPISSILIYSVVFGTFLGGVPTKGNPSGIFNFTLWLTTGLLPWNFTSNGIAATMPMLVGNSNLVKKVYFPREYIVMSSVLSWVTTFLVELVVLSLAFAVFAKHSVLTMVPMLLVVVFLQMLLITGIALVLSSLNVYFRDVQHFTGIGMQVWFYLTPIVYNFDSASIRSKIGGLSWLYRLNPMVHFVDAYRRCLYDGRLPTARSMTFVVLAAFIPLVIGLWLFGRLEPRFAEEL